MNQKNGKNSLGLDKCFEEAENPIELFKKWFSKAKETEINDPNALALATSDNKNQPSVRMVLLKGLSKKGFVFFTNYGSKKAKEAFSTNKVAFNLHWKSLRRQIRVRGHIEKEDGKIADKYFSEREVGSQTAAWASKQSQTLTDRQELIERWQSYKNQFEKNVGRPDFWGGIRIKPIQIEFWADGQYRLHDRFLWERELGEKSWSVRRLYP